MRLRARMGATRHDGAERRRSDFLWPRHGVRHADVAAAICPARMQLRRASRHRSAMQTQCPRGADRSRGAAFSTTMRLPSAPAPSRCKSIRRSGHRDHCFASRSGRSGWNRRADPPGRAQAHHPARHRRAGECPLHRWRRRRGGAGVRTDRRAESQAAVSAPIRAGVGAARWPGGQVCRRCTLLKRRATSHRRAKAAMTRRSGERHGRFCGGTKKCGNGLNCNASNQPLPHA